MMHWLSSCNELTTTLGPGWLIWLMIGSNKKEKVWFGEESYSNGVSAQEKRRTLM
jgi:hypothetical protein